MKNLTTKLGVSFISLFHILITFLVVPWVCMFEIWRNAEEDRNRWLITFAVFTLIGFFQPAFFVFPYVALCLLTVLAGDFPEAKRLYQSDSADFCRKFSKDKAWHRACDWFAQLGTLPDPDALDVDTSLRS